MKPVQKERDSPARPLPLSCALRSPGPDHRWSDAHSVPMPRVRTDATPVVALLQCRTPPGVLAVHSLLPAPGGVLTLFRRVWALAARPRSS